MENDSDLMIEDFVLMMLGAPVVKIELDKAQLQTCISQAKADFQIYAGTMTVSDSVKSDIIRSKALIEATFLLARIRGKWMKSGLSSDFFEFDSKQLYAHGKVLLKEWHRKIRAIKS